MASRKIKKSDDIVVSEGFTIADDALKSNEDGSYIIPDESDDAEGIIESPVYEETGNSDVSDVTFNPKLVEDSVETKEKKNVRVRLKERYHCHIGRTNYEFKEGQCYNVPENVKMVLARANVLDVL